MTTEMFLQQILDQDNRTEQMNSNQNYQFLWMSRATLKEEF